MRKVVIDLLTGFLRTCYVNAEAELARLAPGGDERGEAASERESERLVA